ncbi:hypothetical protein BKA67DRAFT_320075 [Truncatella angustata]|uniref:Uncharacterized protein n=1 Tax=Truncatella angustata TaxID=152316 RepID=A0A9P8UK10_9PEZI|nr:uncharacterized protein BKA67DRAFT_320075 [Truncatella angustata]KAH6653405.1 hypothetical protein BKA67DRAFT_320075 [Truncatella angustata]
MAGDPSSGHYMPQDTPISRQHRDEFEYGALEDQDYPEPIKYKIPRQPAWLQWKFGRLSVLIVVGIGLVLAVFSLGVMVAVIARSVTTNNTSSEPETSDFALYKNSGFKKCYSPLADTYNCTHLLAELSGPKSLPEIYAAEGFGYVSNTHDWCQIVNCFNGFKIIPSTARLSATNLPGIACWWTILVTSITALWHSGTQLAKSSQTKHKSCKGSKDISWIDWMFLAYDVCGPIIWWWVSFGEFASDATKSATIAITSWVTTWKLGRLIQYHPYYCALPGGCRTKRALTWNLNIMAVLQWIASVYVLYVYRGDLLGKASALQSYDCLASQIPDAPGSTPCTTGELCSQNVFFKSGYFSYDTNFPFEGRFTLFFFFLLWTVAALLPFIFAFIVWLHDIISSCFSVPVREDRKNDLQRFNLAPNTLLSLVSFISICAAMFYSTWLLKEGNKNGREGPIIFHRECNALHVQLSPWRYYLDLSDYARAFRVAKMWFNA